MGGKTVPGAMYWRVHDFFAAGKPGPPPAGADAALAARPRALLMLNQPLCRPALLTNVWRNVSVRMCADGGANRLYDMLATDAQRIAFLPDVIRGDMDSLRPEVRAFYESHGVPVQHDPSQDTTDFHKCMHYLVARERAATLPDAHAGASSAAPSTNGNHSQLHDLLVLGATSGRLDQTIASLATLFRLEPARRVYLASNDSICWLVRPPADPAAMHDIYCLKGFEGPCCGIGPLGGEARAVTTGLKWNLNRDMVLAFDKLWSSSNTFDTDATRPAESVVPDDATSHQPPHFLHVRITTDEPVLFTVEVDLA
ncbi:thiamine pyrophosphokinase [Polyrhizophydium stewartii]|uniref:Thiamine pyrophosphokinase n=1 Tax=Polyrhizophydium stewartii TaxID=2732419 RepID=A0ABR4NEY7_9FUNG